MTKRLLTGLACLALAACATESEYGWESDPAEAQPIEETETTLAPGTIDPVTYGSGFCKFCRFQVLDGHRCGLTRPCQLCGREAGARHLHETVWECALHDVVMSEQHECNDAKTCRTCSDEHQANVGTKGCEVCFGQSPVVAIQGITTYCSTCNQEVGANHIHHMTNFCRKCLREAGSNHVHDATRLCLDHETEHSAAHVHGLTEYCHRCHRDAGPDHQHGLTEWCWRCETEMEWPHNHHSDE